jgi:hypothetical protein
MANCHAFYGCIGAIAFNHRFGSSLNEHVHFHACAGVPLRQAAK